MRLPVRDLLHIEHLAVYGADGVKVRAFTGVATDSRAVRKGDIFVALKGENADGHRFVRDALRQGAACAVVENGSEADLVPGTMIMVVRDTVRALGHVANIYRKKFSIPFLAVAGSNGKTTTKDMIAAVLRVRYRVLVTEGNHNNHIGVPQTLFRLMPGHSIAVVEIGTNHFGELAYLCGILNPTHGMITTIGREHLEFFRDLRGVAKAEGELFDYLGQSGTIFVNAGDARVVSLGRRIRKKILYGFEGRNLDVRGIPGGVDAKGCASFMVKPRRGKPFQVSLSVPGRHAMINALAAAAVGLHFKVPVPAIRRALRGFAAAEKRMQIIDAGGVTILNDTYNANPDSVLVALETLRDMSCSGKRIAILADMLELGVASRREHEKIGRALRRMNVEYLLTYGEMAGMISQAADVPSKFHYDQKNMLSEYAAELLSAGDCVLVKGSRGMRMEDVVSFLVQRLGKAAA